MSNKRYDDLILEIKKVIKKKSYPVPVEGTEASTTNAAFYRYLKANTRQQKQKLTEKTVAMSTVSTSNTTNIAGFAIGRGDGLGSDGLDTVAHKGNITVSPKGTKRIGSGWALPTAVFNSIKNALKDAGIKHDENNPYSMMHAMNRLKSEQTRELAQTIAKYSGTRIDFDKFVSDVKMALDYNREVVNKYNHAVDAVAKAIDTQRNNLLKDIWTGKLSTDEANAAVHGWQNEIMGRFAGTRPGAEDPLASIDPRTDPWSPEWDPNYDPSKPTSPVPEPKPPKRPPPKRTIPMGRERPERFAPKRPEGPFVPTTRPNNPWQPGGIFNPTGDEPYPWPDPNDDDEPQGSQAPAEWPTSLASPPLTSPKPDDLPEPEKPDEPDEPDEPDKPIRPRRPAGYPDIGPWITNPPDDPDGEMDPELPWNNPNHPDYDKDLPWNDPTNPLYDPSRYPNDPRMPGWYGHTKVEENETQGSQAPGRFPGLMPRPGYSPRAGSRRRRGG